MLFLRKNDEFYQEKHTYHNEFIEKTVYLDLCMIINILS